MKIGGLVAQLTIVSVILCGCGGSGGGAQPATNGSLTGAALSQAVPQRIADTFSAASLAPEDTQPSSPYVVAAEAYCRQTHGVPETRRAIYGTNNPKPLLLTGEREFCGYTASDKSQIYVLLTTLYSTQPTLAALAYELAPKMGSCEGNPASCYCTLLGGSDQFGGTTGAGGGWYKQDSVNQVLEACIFPDMSSIDSWGLTYHSAGIIRGTNLTKVLRYQYPG